MDIYCFSPFGYEGELVKVEVDLRRGIPAVDIVGLPDSAVRESRDRMQTAIRNAGFSFPRERVLINLSPADVKKEGTAFDLAIAIAVLNASNEFNAPDAIMVLGELELSGKIRPVRGVLAAVSRGIQAGITSFLVPQQNLAEARITGKSAAAGAETLEEAVHALMYFCDNRRFECEGETEQPHDTQTDPWENADSGDFSDIRGQPKLLRAMEIAAAGGHHLFAFGPPGCGKSMALRRFCELLPQLEFDDAVTVTKLASLSEPLLKQGLCTRPPFRMPHHSISMEGLIGGGKHIMPGEISLAHKGVLFLDEAPSFKYLALQSLRAPLESGSVVISRAGRTAQFPAQFQLLMAANPCPCGNLGARGKICVCDPAGIERYWKRFSAPLLDRIDVRIPVSAPDARQLIAQTAVPKENIRSRILEARERQHVRFGTAQLNKHMTPNLVMQFCALDSAGNRLFTQHMNDLHLSARAGHGILKTARTIADLSGSDVITSNHIEEAVDFRRWGDTPWSQPVFQGG